MHFHAEHSVFFESRRKLKGVAASCVLTLIILTINASISSPYYSALSIFTGLLLIVVARLRGHRRLVPVMTWMITLVAVAILAGLALTNDLTHLSESATRVCCGVIWILWLGTQLDWSSLRQILLAVRCPEGVVGSLDHAVMNGILTQREWGRRRDAARLRLGQAWLPLKTWAQIFGGGALVGFLRLESMEENAALRSALAPVSNGDASVTLEGVSVQRGETTVLDEVSLSLKPGEWLLLCGPSGAGKSSLMRLLAGLDEPAKGRMIRFGKTIVPTSTIRERLDGRVGLLSQHPEHHFVASTVVEDITWGLLRRGYDTRQATLRAEEMAQSLRIEHLLHRPCHALSFGEQRRVALAGLLVLEPELLLLDEPTSGLDPVAAHEMKILVGQLAQRTGTTCVWATHDLHALPAQSTRVSLLHHGRLIFDGPMDEGLSRPWLLKAGLALPQNGQT